MKQSSPDYVTTVTLHLHNYENNQNSCHGNNSITMVTIPIHIINNFPFSKKIANFKTKVPAVTKRSEQLTKGSIKDKTMIAGVRLPHPLFMHCI